MSIDMRIVLFQRCGRYVHCRIEFALKPAIKKSTVIKVINWCGGGATHKILWRFISWLGPMFRHGARNPWHDTLLSVDRRTRQRKRRSGDAAAICICQIVIDILYQCMFASLISRCAYKWPLFQSNLYSTLKIGRKQKISLIWSKPWEMCDERKQKTDGKRWKCSKRRHHRRSHSCLPHILYL